MSVSAHFLSNWSVRVGLGYLLSFCIEVCISMEQNEEEVRSTETYANAQSPLKYDQNDYAYDRLSILDRVDKQQPVWSKKTSNF